MEKIDHTGICTLGLVRNVTGKTITHRANDDRAGHIMQNCYPDIETSKWGFFVHGNLESGGSRAGVVYSCKDASGNDCDWVLAWSNLLPDANAVTWVYTDIRTRGHYYGEDIWNEIFKKMEELKKQEMTTAAFSGLIATMKIVGDSFYAKIKPT